MKRSNGTQYRGQLILLAGKTSEEMSLGQQTQVLLLRARSDVPCKLSFFVQSRCRTRCSIRIVTAFVCQTCISYLYIDLYYVFVFCPFRLYFISYTIHCFSIVSQTVYWLFICYSLDEYKNLGLATKPNTGDNGVHASASPFEALAERVNWLGKSVEDDSFGKGLLAAGIPKELISKWSGDAQVSVKGETKDGQTMSVFDTLEDLNADTILDKVTKISK